MSTITTKLVRDGNSAAVRLPKTVLIMSGLGDDLLMDVKHGQITLRSARTPRAGWKEQIAKVLATDNSSVLADTELDDWEVASNDGLDQTR
jgi:antitoxin component of MazEF toxin-antitoxin module